LSLSSFFAIIVLATIEGGLVALPRADALAQLNRLRSPAWAALLPGSILVGTFAPLAGPSLARALVALAAVATPALAVVAILTVIRGPKPALIAAGLGLALGAARVTGWLGETSDSLVTALGCLALGAALVRLIPVKWMLVGVVCMCAADVVLLMSGAGETASQVMAGATASVHLPTFDQAAFGPIATDYPDLVLAGVLGGFLAGQRYQGRAAMLLIALAAGSGMLLPVVGWLPATVPVTVAFVIFCLEHRTRPADHMRPAARPAVAAASAPAPHEAAA
jgi:hypothetical protein